MPVPKRKHSRSRRDSKSANKGLEVKSITSCQTCQSPISGHQVCKDCGYYKGIKVLRTKTDRMHERGQVRRAQQASKQASLGQSNSAEKAGE